METHIERRESVRQREFVRDGEIILRQGMIGNHAYRIESGTIVISMKYPDGEEVTLAELGPGEIVGEMAAMFGSRRCASARAHGDAILSIIPGQALQQSAQKPGGLHDYLMDLVANRTIRNIPLFSGLTDEERAALPKGEGPFRYADKELLFREDDPIEYLYIVCSGHVQEFRTTVCGHEITTDLHKAGDVFSKSAAFMKDGIFHSSARAIGDAHIIKLPLEQFKEIMKKHESVAGRLLSSLAQFAVMKQLEVEQHATMTAPQILAAFLQQLCVSYGLDPRGFTLPYKKALIASRLGMEMETLSRAWPKLKDLGIIVKGSHISFTDEKTE